MKSRHFNLKSGHVSCRCQKCLGGLLTETPSLGPLNEISFPWWTHLTFEGGLGVWETTQLKLSMLSTSTNMSGPPIMWVWASATKRERENIRFCHYKLLDLYAFRRFLPRPSKVGHPRESNWIKKVDVTEPCLGTPSHYLATYKAHRKVNEKNAFRGQTFSQSMVWKNTSSSNCWLLDTYRWIVKYSKQ